MGHLSFVHFRLEHVVLNAFERFSFLLRVFRVPAGQSFPDSGERDWGDGVSDDIKGVLSTSPPNE